jgi:hypothetical protein
MATVLEGGSVKYEAQMKLRIEVGAPDMDSAGCVIADWVNDVGAYDVDVLSLECIDYEQD